MNSAANEVEAAQSDLKKRGVEISHLIKFGEMLSRVSEESFEPAIAEFHNLAGRIPYWQDRDVGAIILERVADSMSQSPKQLALYQHAKYRAGWCAAAATAGGEGLSRSQHVDDLRTKIKSIT